MVLASMNDPAIRVKKVKANQEEKNVSLRDRKRKSPVNETPL